MSNNSYMKDLFNFLDKSYSVYHAVDNIKEILLKNNFKELKENEDFILKEGDKCFITKNLSSIIAFKIGNKLTNDYGFNILASHSDSPSFKLKPNPVVNKMNYQMFNVESYGGGIFHSFLNKPLSIAGRVCINEGDSVKTKLFNCDKNLAVIASLPIHFNREVNSNLNLNPQVDLMPLITEGNFDFLDFIANNLNIKKEDVLSHDLYLYNREKSEYIGLNDEYFGSKKIDNLESAYCTLQGFLNSDNKENISVYACFDNEEIGSKTKQGADSIFLSYTLKRINDSLGKADFKKALANSLMVSVDNAHAVNPNHPEKYDSTNQVFMNKGIVIKNNANQSYTTDAISSALFKKIMNKGNIKYQEFANRSDIRGGSTLGDLASSYLSILSLDIGLAQLAMHSSYEIAGVYDVLCLIKSAELVLNSSIRFISDGKYNII